MHFILFVVAVVMTPISALTGLSHRLPYIVMISMLALVSGEISAWQAARSEEATDSADVIAKKVILMLEKNGFLDKKDE